MDEYLEPTHPFPADRSFVLKLDRDADLAGGQLSGRIVHLVSDERTDFAGDADLLCRLRALIRSTLSYGGSHAATPTVASH